MSDLSRLARINKIFGSQMYAQVEETHLGYTTVRLASNGARLTNLYTVGHVVANDTVIVEYGTDGVPYVRPTTVATIEEEDVIPALELGSEPDIIPPDTVLPVCKVSRSGSQTIPLDALTNIVLNKKIFDPTGMSDGTGIRIKESGNYLIHGTVGINVNSGNTNYGLYLHFYERSGTNHILCSTHRRANGSGHIPMSVCTMHMLYSGETIRLNVHNDNSKAPTIVLSSSSKYPILEVWRISKIVGQGRVLT